MDDSQIVTTQINEQRYSINEVAMIATGIVKDYIPDYNRKQPRSIQELTKDTETAATNWCKAFDIIYDHLNRKRNNG